MISPTSKLQLWDFEGGNLHLSQPLHNVQHNRVSFLDAAVQNEQEIFYQLPQANAISY